MLLICDRRVFGDWGARFGTHGQSALAVCLSSLILAVYGHDLMEARK